MLFFDGIYNIKAELQESRQMMQEDWLTGAQNRRAMDQVLGKEVARAQRSATKLSVAMVDIDHFKHVNDEFGHDAGDKLLQHLTLITKSVLRESDSLVRYGGEEFLVILPETDIKGCEFVMGRLQQAFQKNPLQYEGKSIQVTFSAGLAHLSPDENGHAMVMRADTALYERNSGLGVDLSHGMLLRGAAKLARAGLATRATLAGGDGERLPVRDARFDGAVVGFGIRNVADPVAAMREVRRALRRGGRFVVLEFSMPAGAFGAAYRFYFRHVLPRLGGLVSGDASAYAYLPASVARFPTPGAFAGLMGEAGFVDVRWRALTGGIACLHRGERPR